VVGTLRAQEAALGGLTTLPSPGNSRVVWAENFVPPGGTIGLQGYLLIKNEDGDAAPFDMDTVEVDVQGSGHAELRALGAGIASVQIFADSGSAGEDLIIETSLDQTLLERVTVPIERDATLAAEGYGLVGGTCALHHRAVPHQTYPALFTLLLGFLSPWRRRRRRAA
jgi:hypothetical protein